MPDHSVIVTFDLEGFHRWPDAPDRRDYLRERHRHLFKVRVELFVDSADREIEAHDLRDFARRTFGGGDKGDRSCETMARELAEAIATRLRNRPVRVEVLEDGEVGGAYASCPGYH